MHLFWLLFEIWPFFCISVCLVTWFPLLFTGIEGIGLPAGEAPDHAQRWGWCRKKLCYSQNPICNIFRSVQHNRCPVSSLQNQMMVDWLTALLGLEWWWRSGGVCLHKGVEGSVVHTPLLVALLICTSQTAVSITVASSVICYFLLITCSDWIILRLNCCF